MQEIPRIADGRLSLTGAFDFALERLDALGHGPQTVRTNARTIRRLARYANRGLGLRALDELNVDVVRAFVHAPDSKGRAPSVGSMHTRRAGVLLAFRVFAFFDFLHELPATAIPLPSRSTLLCRPLTDEELELCRWASMATLTETRQPAVFALAAASAVTSEIATIRVEDFDFEAGTVRLPGCKTAEPRVARLDDWWSLSQLSRRVDAVRHGLLAYEGSGTPEAAQASTSNAIVAVLQRAGLGGDRDLGVGSVRAHAGLVAYRRRHRIEDAALVLGTRSLDSAARVIGLEWR